MYERRRIFPERSLLFMKNGQLSAAEEALSRDKTPLCYQKGGFVVQTVVFAATNTSLAAQTTVVAAQIIE